MVCVCTKHYPRCNVWVAQKFQHELWLLTTETWRVTFDVADDKKTLWLGASNEFMNSFGAHLEGELAGNRPMDRCSKALIRSLQLSLLILGFRHRIGGTLRGDDRSSAGYGDYMRGDDGLNLRKSHDGTGEAKMQSKRCRSLPWRQAEARRLKNQRREKGRPARSRRNAASGR